jgi:hypothetical protein
MTLIIEKHPDISRLSHCFKKIETLANDLGLEVDELIIDKFKKVRTSEVQSPETQKELAKHRAGLLREKGWKIIW